jgi:hypothetical protein
MADTEGLFKNIWIMIVEMFLLGVALYFLFFSSY